MSASQGICYVCGKTLGKIAMKNHLLSEHRSEPEQECRLVKIEGAEDKNYWLYIEVPASASLSTVDTFLRKIWLECCGHLSAFETREGSVGKARKLGSIPVGTKLLHTYDFGTPTECVITIQDVTRRKEQRGIRLLARNLPPVFHCTKCGEIADYINAQTVYDLEPEYLCENCAIEDESLLPVVNSPRMGVCGYCGEFDNYAYIPSTKGTEK